MKPSLREMEVFRRVVELGGVTATAAALNVSQPAVSRTLQALEARLGFALFRRHRKRLVPTAEAHLLYPKVVEAFAAFAAVGHQAADLRDGGSGTLRVASIAAFANALMPQAIRRFREDRPRVAVALQATSAADTAGRVLDNRADVGFVIGPVPVDGLLVEEFCRAEVGCVLPRDHPLARRRRLGPADLAGEALICLAPHLPLGALVGQAFAAANVPYRVAIEVTQSTIARALVRAGAGIALLDALVAVDPPDGEVAFVPLRPAVTVTGHVVVARDRPPAALAAEFVARVREALPGLAAGLKAPDP